MTPTPTITGRQLLRALQRAGFSVARVKGSHDFLSNGQGQRTTVPVHSGETFGPGLLSKILRDCGLTRQTLETPS